MGAPQDDMGRFVSRMLGSTELQWKQIFAQDGKTYRAPVLVLYRGVTHVECGGVAQSAMGPFYCPSDQKVYLDTPFFDPDRDPLSRLRSRQQVLRVGAGLCDRA